MPIFECEECGCVDNTALTRYWHRKRHSDLAGRALCSACDPEINQWHGAFPREKATGLLLCNDGFLYSKRHYTEGNLKWRIKNQGLEVIKCIGIGEEK